MPRVTHRLRVGILAILMLILMCVPLRVFAATNISLIAPPAPKVIITELQTSAATGSQEFIELYNVTDTDIDFADTAHGGQDIWKLQFFSSSSTASGNPDWTKPAASLTLNGMIPAHDYYLIAATDYAPGGIDSDQPYSPRLADTGGALQLSTVTPTNFTVYDRVLWKQATDSTTLPAGVVQTPPAKGSLQRAPNDDTEYVNADGTLTDFISSATISPKDMWQAPVPEAAADPAPDSSNPDPEPADGTAAAGDTDTALPAPDPEQVPTAPANEGLAMPVMTELLPNPAAPLTDGNDEFIELYNPNQTPFNLKGYTLEVGTTTLHDFTITTDVLIDPLSYRALYSSETGLSLTNTGGQARLLGPDSAVVAETASYTAAPDGAAWAFDGGTWQWSTTASPNVANVITVPAEPAKKPAVSKTNTSTAAHKSAAKKPTAKLTSAKVKGVSSIKAKKPTVRTKKPTKVTAGMVAQTGATSTGVPIHTGVLVAVGAFAVLYAGYEYRADISNRLYKLRYNRTLRRVNREEA